LSSCKIIVLISFLEVLKKYLFPFILPKAEEKSHNFFKEKRFERNKKKLKKHF